MKLFAAFILSITWSVMAQASLYHHTGDVAEPEPIVAPEPPTVVASDEHDAFTELQKAEQVGISNLYADDSFVGQLATLPVLGTLFFNEKEANLVGGDLLVENDKDSIVVPNTNKIYELNIRMIVLGVVLLIALPIIIGLMIQRFKEAQRVAMIKKATQKRSSSSRGRSRRRSGHSRRHSTSS